MLQVKPVISLIKMLAFGLHVSQPGDVAIVTLIYKNLHFLFWVEFLVGKGQFW